MLEKLTDNPNAHFISLLIQDAELRPDDYPKNGLEDQRHDLRSIAALMLADTKLGIEIVSYGNKLRVNSSNTIIGEIENSSEINTVDALMTILKNHYAPDHLRGEFHKTVTNRLLRQITLPHIHPEDLTKADREERALEIEHLPDYFTQPFRLLNALLLHVRSTEFTTEVWSKRISPEILTKEAVLAFRLYQYSYYNSFNTIVMDGMIGQVDITRSLLFSMIKHLDQSDPIYSPEIETALSSAQHILRSKDFLRMLLELTQLPNAHLIPEIRNPLCPTDRWQYFVPRLCESKDGITFTEHYQNELDNSIHIHNARSRTFSDISYNKPYTVISAATTSGCPFSHGVPSRQAYSDDRKNISFFPEEAIKPLHKHPIINLNDNLIELIEWVKTDTSLQERLLAE